MADKTEDKSVYEGIMKGLSEAKDFFDGKDTSKVKVTKRTRVKKSFAPAKVFSSDDIKRIRAKYELTQNELSGLFNVSADAVKSWEQGSNPISGANARLLEMLENDAAMLDRFLYKS